MNRKQIGILLGTMVFHLIGIVILKKRFFLPMDVIFLHLSVVVIIHFIAYWVIRMFSVSRYASSLTITFIFLYYFLFSLLYILNYVSLKEWGDYFSYKTLVVVGKSADELMSNFSNDLLPITLMILLISFIVFYIARYITPRVRGIKANKYFGIIWAGLAIALLGALMLNLGQYRLQLKFKGEPLYNFFKSVEFSFDEQKIKFNYNQEVLSFQNVLSDKKSSSPSNIILIVVDALRYDRLSFNGYKRDTSPFLDSLSRLENFVSVQEMRSNCSTSFCGILSVLSGVPIYDLSPSNYKINDALSDLDYRCHFILSGAHNDWYQLRRAYEFYNELDLYHEGTFNKELPVADDQALIEVLDGIDFKDKQGNFIYLHMMSTHRTGSKHESHHKFFPDGPLTYFNPDSTLHSNHYDNGILQTDHFIKEMFSVLKAKNLTDDYMVFITADHGESLGEHEKFGHSGNLSEANIRIPLIYYSNLKHLSVDQKRFYTHTDLAPMILNQVVELDQTIWSQPNEKSYSYHQQAYNYAVVYNNGDKKYKLWYNEKLKTYQLFELDSDPKEIHNLFQESTYQSIGMQLQKQLKHTFNIIE